MTMKNFLFVVALLSLALASGCAKGGSGPCVNNCPAVTVNDNQQIVAGVNLSIAMTATVTGTSQTAVNWTITGLSCTGSGNPCGTLTNVTASSATYNAPSAVPANAIVTVVATLQSDSNVSGTQDLTIIADTANVTPGVVNVAVGLNQQFVATAVPDQAPQTFTWSCLANGVACANFIPGPNDVGTAVYQPTAAEKCGPGCVEISAVTTIDPTGCTPTTCTIPKLNVVAARLSGTYAFQFSGFDNSGKPVMAAGTFTVGAGGVITGTEDIYTSAGLHQYAIGSGSYTPLTPDPNNISNNQGTLILNSGASPSQFLVVLDGPGDLQMIESDNNGSGSGFAESTSNFDQTKTQTYAFGFTGVESSGNNRVGYVGLLPMDGNGNVVAGMIDVNDNGNSSNSVCAAPPCAVTGTYTYANNVGHLMLTSPIAMNFDFFVANGHANAGNSPLTMYAISTDVGNPAVMGTMIFQDSSGGAFNNGAFKGTSVSALVGANANVSLTLGTTDGATDSSGNGGFTGSFDQNNNGTEISAAPTAPFAYKYAASGTSGRYTFQMLGNPSAKPAVPPLPFVLYASGENRGFLMDQSSSAVVITGTMNPQNGPKANAGSFSNSLMPSTYAVATNNNTLASIAPLTMNLLLTFPGGSSTPAVVGTENPGNQPVKGTYAVQSSGVGTLTLTAPASNYIFYGVDATHFYMMRDASKDTGVAGALLFMEQ